MLSCVWAWRSEQAGVRAADAGRIGIDTLALDVYARELKTDTLSGMVARILMRFATL